MNDFNIQEKYFSNIKHNLNESLKSIEAYHKKQHTVTNALRSTITWQRSNDINSPVHIMARTQSSHWSPSAVIAWSIHDKKFSVKRH